MKVGAARAGITLALACLVAYGSLYPFQFHSPDVSLKQLLSDFLTQWHSDGRLADLIGNIALFLPLGVLTASGPRRARGDRLSALLWILAWGVFAASLQVAQLWLPGRIAALSDVFWNLVGVAIGMLAARWFRGFQIHFPVQPTVALLLVVWLLAEGAPLVPALGWQEFKDSLKPLLLTPHFDAGAFALQFAMALAVAKLLDSVPRFKFSALKFAAVLFGVLALQLIAVRRTVELSTVLAFAGAWSVWVGLGWRTRSRGHWLVILLLGAFTLEELLPLRLADVPREFHWLPFAAVLRGNMLDAAINLSTLLFLFGAVMWLVKQAGGRVWPAAVAVSLWVFLLEASQTLLDTHTPDITPALIVLGAGALVQALAMAPGASTPSAAISPRSQPIDRPTLMRQDNSAAAGSVRHALGWAAGLALAMALVMHWVIALPGVPYNVRELFLGDFFLFKLIFALALLWFGVGSALMADRLSRARRANLELPLLLLGVCLTSLLLLSISVSNESIMDIAGSNNLNWFIIHRQIWGASAAELLRWLDAPGLVAAIERPLRYTALVGPLVLSLALIGTVWLRAKRGAFSTSWWVTLVVSALPWYWLSKAIAFDWSSTDNLNELIARDAAWGLGGGAYLYLLLLLTSAHVVLLARARPGRGRVLVAAGATMLAVPVSWWLFKHGLDPAVEKYGTVFSGPQFLLGPDRSHALTPVQLFGRWAAIYLGMVGVTAAGFRIGVVLADRVVGAASTARHAVRPAAPPGNGGSQARQPQR